MLIPYNTDAPIYHWPYATVGMIAANVLVFIGVNTSDLETATWAYENLALVYGHGLLPWQWVTSNFMHAGIMHLLSNMFSLWGFGIIVEGKIGWQRFLVIFFGIGITQCAIEQTIMLFVEEGASLGASSIIFGLMAIALLWAPLNELNCILLLFRVIWIDITVALFAGISVLMEILTVALFGLSMGSEVLHLMGAALGFAIGAVMLRRGMVDCERWDAFSLLTGKGADQQMSEKEEIEEEAKRLLDEAHRKLTQRDDESANSTQTNPPPAYVPAALPGQQTFASTTVQPTSLPPPATAPAEQLPPQLLQIRQALASGATQQAVEIHQAARSQIPGWKLPERELLSLISRLQQQKMWSQSVPLMVEYLGSYYEKETPIRLKLAQILMTINKRPDQALNILQHLNEGLITPQELQQLQKLRAQAQQMLNQAK